MSNKSEGDSKLQTLRSQSHSLCAQDLKEHKKHEVQQKVRSTEEQWTRVLEGAKEAVSRAEKHVALYGQLRDFETLKEKTRGWLDDKQQSLLSLDSQTSPEQAINTAQVSLIHLQQHSHYQLHSKFIFLLLFSQEQRSYRLHIFFMKI